MNAKMNTSKMDWEKLKAKNQEIINNNPDNIMAIFKVAISLANTGKIKKAYNLFEELDDKISEEEFHKKINPYLKALKKDPDNILLLNYAAFNEVIKDDYKKAINFFKHLIKLEPKNVWIRNFLAASYNEIEKYFEAEVVLNKALEIKDNEYSHLLLGITYYERGSLLKALGQFAQSGNLINEILKEN